MKYPYTIAEVRLVLAKHVMDPYHRDLMCWLVDQLTGTERLCLDQLRTKQAKDRVARLKMTPEERSGCLFDTPAPVIPLNPDLETSAPRIQPLQLAMEDAIARDLAQDRSEQEAILAEDRAEQARLEELALQEEAEDEARRQDRSWDSDP